MEEEYNANLTASEWQLILAGLGELQVKTGAHNLGAKIQRTIQAQQMAKQPKTTEKAKTKGK